MFFIFVTNFYMRHVSEIFKIMKLEKLARTTNGSVR